MARNQRHDGWSIDRQLAFLSALMRSRSVSHAAAAAGMSREGAYRLRKRPGAAAFAAAWDRAIMTPAKVTPLSGRSRSQTATVALRSGCREPGSGESVPIINFLNFAPVSSDATAPALAVNRPA